ncbi:MULTISPECIES: AIM24 family protein [Corynebacterium]|nr:MULTISPECIES: AIM24 family protein [Corynebacterium]MCT1564317.1 AIM24 family protein [Corynebacterium glucuronolyticum]
MRSPLFEQSNMENETRERWTMQSKKMLRVVVTEDNPVIATAGAMVAYQGRVKFNHQSSGSLGKFFKKHLTGEDTPMMRVTGDGEVFFARDAANVFLMELEGGNDGLSVNSSSLLAYDPTLDDDIRRLRGAGSLLSGAGLFNVNLTGRGMVALCSKGTPLVLDCSQQDTFVDPQAAVCWSANLAPEITTDINLNTFIGRGSGEAFQMRFSGPGFVVVQPSEGIGTPVLKAE